MESTPEESAEGLAIVRVLAKVLDWLVCTNAPVALSHAAQGSKFHATKAPAIAIQQYLERIHKYASCSNECFILALIYIDRLIQRNNFLLTELNVHRVVITAVLLAAKFFDDAYYNNAYYAKVGGVLTPEINELEVDFLFRINFSLYVTTDEFDKYRSELLTHLVTINTPMLVPETPELHAYSNTCAIGTMQVSPRTTSPQYQQLQHMQQHQLTPQQHDIVVAAAAALAGQVGMQQGYDLRQQQNQANHPSNIGMSSSSRGCGLGMFQNDIALDNFAHITSQITPSPPYPCMVSIDPNPLINSNLQNSASSIDDVNSNAILQSLEFLQQTLDNSNSSNNGSFGYGPSISRTHSLPVNLGCGASSAQYYDPTHFAIMNHTNATFPNIIPQSCPISSIPNDGNVTSYPVCIDEQYLRLLVENTQQQLHSQPQHHINPVYEDDIFHRQNSLQQIQQQQYRVHQYHTSRMNDTSMPVTITMSSSPVGAYSNLLALQQEARRIAATQGQMLAATGLSGSGFL